MRCLIFSTTYVDTPDKARLLSQGLALTARLNPEHCDILVIDSASPYIASVTFPKASIMFYDFGDNIGHMARGGRDGWGRAFCFGIESAIKGRYDYVAHIEGDSLFRKPCVPLFEEMWEKKIHCASIPVNGTKVKETGWVETGLMLMSVHHMRRIDLVGKYDWATGGKLYPKNPPEKVVHDIIGRDITMMPWRGQRDQACRLKPHDIADADLDWLTQATPEVTDEFFRQTMSAMDYDASFFNMHRPWKHEYRAIADILNERFSREGQRGAFDLGCGNGYILTRLEEHGWSVCGIDGSPEVLKHYPNAVIADLSKPMKTAKLPLVICTEVAEHIPPECADQLVNNIANASTGDASAAIFFSAAKAGRGGHLHLNEQDQAYWIEKFSKCGFAIDEEASKEIRWAIAERTSAIWWFALNAMVFRRA